MPERHLLTIGGNLTDKDLSVAIIGSGFAGLCMGIKLKEAGFQNFTILEKAGRIGGTWRENTYPGAACDAPSFLYSFSFEPNPRWSRKFAEQPEILEYIEHCARKYGLIPHIQLNTEIGEAKWDDDDGSWKIRAKDGREFSARVLVSGCGQLNRPQFPKIPGMETFKGTAFHSAQWRHDHDLSGERVAVIGNGASALQFIPKIAPKAKRLTLFQRSPYWVVPKPERIYGGLAKAIFSHVPLAARLYRYWIYLQHESRWPAFSRDSWLGSLTKGIAKKYIKSQIADPELRRKLTPDFPVGCKRVLISNDYYSTLTRENVEVVDDPIARVTESGVETKSGRSFEADTIIYGTGFESTSFLAPMRIVGRKGRVLNERWKEGAEAYLGVAVPEFPNFFLLYGPNTNLGHNSIIFMIESQVNYIMHCVGEIARGVKSLEVREEAMRAFSGEMQRQLEHSVWGAGCSSWYKTDSGRITNNWAYSTVRYWWRMRRPDFSAFVSESAGKFS